MVVPTLDDGVIILNEYIDADIAAHLDGQDDETKRQFGDPSHPDLTPAEVRSGFAWWARQWETGGPIRTFAARDAVTGQLVGGCQLELQPGGPAQVSRRREHDPVPGHLAGQARDIRGMILPDRPGPSANGAGSSSDRSRTADARARRAPGRVLVSR